MFCIYYTENASIVSVILGVDIAQQKWVNLTSVEQADRQNEIVQMCWNNSDQNEVSRFCSR